MNLRNAPTWLIPAEAAIASVLSAIEASDRSLKPAAPRVPYVAGFGRQEAWNVPCPADFGLSAREAGMWGRLRATGLSEAGAADVVKAARINGVPR